MANPKYPLPCPINPPSRRHYRPFPPPPSVSHPPTHPPAATLSIGIPPDPPPPLVFSPEPTSARPCLHQLHAASRSPGASSSPAVVRPGPPRRSSSPTPPISSCCPCLSLCPDLLSLTGTAMAVPTPCCLERPWPCAPAVLATAATTSPEMSSPPCPDPFLPYLLSLFLSLAHAALSLLSLQCCHGGPNSNP